MISNNLISKLNCMHQLWNQKDSIAQKLKCHIEQLFDIEVSQTLSSNKFSRLISNNFLMLIKFLIEHIVCSTLKLQLSLGRIVQFKDYTRIEGRECSLKLTNFGCYCLIRFWSYSFHLDDDRFKLFKEIVTILFY